MCTGSFGSEILRETICNTGPLPFKNLLGFEGSWLYSSQAQAKELDPWWFQQHCEQRGVDRHREQNRNNQHLKELVNFNRFDSRIPGPNSSKDLNCHRCHELIWNLQHSSIFYSWKPSITINHIYKKNHLHLWSYRSSRGSLWWAHTSNHFGQQK